MLSKKIQDRLNDQIQRELFSSHLYLAMSSYCSSLSLVGFARWLRTQSEEERGHALKLLDYVETQQGQVVLQALEKPTVKVKSVLELFESVLEHEQHITKCIHELYGLALAEKDFPTHSFLSWYVNEQVEEEATVQLIIDKLKMIGSSTGSLLYLDKEYGKRSAEA